MWSEPVTEGQVPHDLASVRVRLGVQLNGPLPSVHKALGLISSNQSTIQSIPSHKIIQFIQADNSKVVVRT
jgi:hypothetical protein